MRGLFGKLFSTNFCKFVIVGIINTIFGTGVMLLLYHVFHFNYWISSASNYIFGSMVSYILNKIFTFRNKECIYKTLPRFILNIGLCYLLAYGVAKIFITYALSQLPIVIQENIAMLTGMCLFVVLNYIGQSVFVFKK